MNTGDPNRELPPGQQLAAAHKWPVVGERAARQPEGDWTVRVDGACACPLELTLAQLAELPQVEQVVDVHCVTRWSKPQMRFSGAPLEALLAVARPTEAARYVIFTAHSGRNHDTSLMLADAIDLKVLIALAAEGKPLAPEHGGPVRVVTPGRYFYKSLKWLARIELATDDRLGYWEREAGYHNEADPWREQRYLAPSLDRAAAAQRIQRRDFAAADLRSLSAASHDLSGLNARDALLRDADFRGSVLQGADFRGANLSNARLQGADLRGATFVGADCEGAAFDGADLRGADFRAASLFGASFTGEPGDALLDVKTHIPEAAVETLTPRQAEFVRRRFDDLGRK